MELDIYDKVFLIGYVLFVVPMAISLFYEYDTILQTIGDWLVMLTHFVVIPAILVKNKIQWYVLILLYSLISSVFYHLAKLNFIAQVKMLSNWDIAAQNVLILSTFALLLYHPNPIPQLWYLLIAGSGIVVASMGELQIFEIHIYQIIAGVVMISLIIYLIYQFLYPSQFRVILYIIISSILAVVACVTFIVSGNIGTRKYSMCHSIWHISAYVMLYFLLKSIKTDYQQLGREKRKLFSMFTIYNTS